MFIQLSNRGKQNGNNLVASCNHQFKVLAHSSTTTFLGTSTSHLHHLEVILLAFKLLKHQKNDNTSSYVPPPKVRGNISFSADPGHRHWRDSLYPPYFLNQWVEFYQTCMATSLGQAKELIKFW